MSQYRRYASTESYDSTSIDTSNSYAVPAAHEHQSIAQRTSSLYSEGLIYCRDAQSAWNHLYQREPLREGIEAGDVEQFETRLYEHVEEVYLCMINVEDPRETTSNAFKDIYSGKIPQQDFEATAWALAQAILLRHLQGPLLRVKKVSVADRDLPFRLRWEAICDNLRRDKLLCEDVVKRHKVEEFVHKPNDSFKTKEQNKAINYARKDILAAGNEALGNSRRKADGAITKSTRARKPSPSVKLTTRRLRSFTLPVLPSLSPGYSGTNRTLPSCDNIANDLRHGYPFGPNLSIGGSHTRINRPTRPPPLPIDHETNRHARLPHLSPPKNQQIDPTLSQTPTSACSFIMQLDTLETDPRPYGPPQKLEDKTSTVLVTGTPSAYENTPTFGGMFTPGGSLNSAFIPLTGNGFGFTPVKMDFEPPRQWTHSESAQAGDDSQEQSDH